METENHLKHTDLEALEEQLYFANKKGDIVEAWKIASQIDELKRAR